MHKYRTFFHLPNEIKLLYFFASSKTKSAENVCLFKIVYFFTTKVMISNLVYIGCLFIFMRYALTIVICCQQKKDLYHAKQSIFLFIMSAMEVLKEMFGSIFHRKVIREFILHIV